jgi:hypothetical protein
MMRHNKMTTTLNTRKYSAPEYDGFQTAPEILQAIETVAGDDILADSVARKIWTAPTQEQANAVYKIAFSFTEESELSWGTENVIRIGV